MIDAERHTVTLPHPLRRSPEEETQGFCTCNKVVFTYVWGQHGAAADKAEQHIIEAALAHPVQFQELSGTIIVMEGMSI